MPVSTKFKWSLRNGGIARVVFRDRAFLKVAWNRADAANLGGIISDSFTVTEFALCIGNNWEAKSCSNCEIFQSSLICTDMRTTTCPHTMLAADIAIVLKYTEGTLDIFQHWLLSQLAITKGVQPIHCPRSVKFFVLIPMQEAHELSLNAHSVCVCEHGKGNTSYVKCHSMSCKKMNNQRTHVSVDSRDSMCPHLRTLIDSDAYKKSSTKLSYSVDDNEDLDASGYETSSDSDDENDNGGGEGSESHMFTRYDAASDVWVPCDGCTSAVVPRDLSGSMHTLQRKMGKGLQMAGEALVIINKMLVGQDCVPANMHCNVCSISMKRMFKHTMKVRTHIGCVARKVYEGLCQQCGAASKWDPASEHLHTILNGKEAGTFSPCFVWGAR